ncbi:MAG TPA: hypothetical protein PK728_07190 [Bacillota bacterium]|nr:hypothetical protein [Bacillota bacterium]
MYRLLELYEQEKDAEKTSLSEICEYEFLYRNKPATVYQFSNGAKIIGYITGLHFDLRIISLGENPRRKGYGQEMLKLLRPKFKRICVNDIYEEALPFWRKMMERGLVDELVSLRNERKIS